MKSTLKSLFLFFAALFFSAEARATHIIGGEIFYDSLGLNTYKITIDIFRDCQSFTDFDNPFHYTIYYADGTLFGTYYLSDFTRDTLSLIDDYPCATPPDDFCVEKAVFVDTVVLPFSPDGFYIVYQRCCWTGTIGNIQNPSENGITLKATIPGSSLVSVPNNSARFINYPPLVLCSGSISTYDHSAFDQDSDSLVYTLIDPLLGGSIANVQPDPEPAEPYAPVNWNPGFNTMEQLGTGAIITINSASGLMTFNPSLVGMFVVGVQVQEFRDGILIHSKIRTYGYRVVACETIEAPEVNVFGSQLTVENCGESGFIITRTNTSSEITFGLTIGGNATNGVDYTQIPNIVSFETGQDTIFVSIVTAEDNLEEGPENVILEIIWEDPCTGTIDSNSFSLIINDYTPLSISALDSANICDEAGEIALLYCSVLGGVPPYGYAWYPANGYSPNDSIFVNGNDCLPNQNLFFVVASDQCGNDITSPPILVYEQCPLQAPNVITTNQDGINDLFVIKNLDDYDRVSVKIYNRWGNVVFETNDYQNDWNGKSESGQKLVNGVYFYEAVPTSEKYQYDDSKRSLYTVHGFLQLID